MTRYGDPVETAAARAAQDRELAERFRKKEPDQRRPEPETMRLDQVNEPKTITPDRQPERAPVAFGTSVAAAPQTAKPHKVPRNSNPEWVPSGQSIEVAGYVIDGGLLYVCHSRAQMFEETEPSLIDPNLPVNSGRPDYAGTTFSYWPSYDRLTPEARAAYLEWLGHGRRDADVPIGYVFLFMYGLEHRVLIDIATNPSLSHEVPTIRAEMKELLALHEDDYSFQSYGSGFMNVLDLLMFQGDSTHEFDSPDLSEYRWTFPLGLKVRLGSFAADGEPVSAEWALAWAWYHPGTRIHTPATRCFAEFSTQFMSMYTAAHGEGLIPKPGKRKVQITYNPASSAIGMAEVSIDGIPDVSESSRITTELERIADQAQDALDSYSRFVGKYPDAVETLRARALLPAELLDTTTPTVAQLEYLMAPASAGLSSIDAAELIDLWNGSPAERLTKPESIQMCQLAEKLGFGLEPDPRFGGPALQAGTGVAVFALAPGAPHISSPEFTTALTLTHLAIAVSASDGFVIEAETATLFRHVESSLGLTDHERARLEAHARWLAQSDIKLTGLTKRLETLTNDQRENLGRLLVDIAVVDGVVKPEEVRTIGKIYKLLKLDDSLVTSRLHQAMTGSPALRDEPITVRQAQQADPGMPVPPRPVSAPARNRFTLDHDSIAAKMRDTATVSALLQNIFDDDNTPATTGRRVATDQGAVQDASIPVTVSQAEPEEECIAGLDVKHSELFRHVTQGADVDRTEFDDLCQQLGLLPNGALDTLNDAAVEVCDEPLVDGDEELTINQYALEEMLR